MKHIYTCITARYSAILALTCLLLLSPKGVAFGKNYYFSTSIGDDSRTAAQAQNAATPWKTINKLNSYFANLLPGDSILFKRSETFYGSIIVNKSGNSSQDLIISAYGNGSNPIISAFQTITGWTNLGNGIFESAATNSKSSLNMVTVNGTYRAVGRYPNTGYLSFETAVANTSITDNQLNGTINWTGAQVVIRCNNWSISKGTITNHSNNTISYSGASQNANPNYGYFIQRDPKTLDSIGEWYLNPSTKKIQMYFGITIPSTYVVKASALDTLVYCNQKNYITFNDLSFEGANYAALFIASGQNVTIKNCIINNSGTFGIYGYSNSPNLKIENNIISNSYHKAIQTLCDNTSIRHNTIKYTGLVPGMGNEIGGYSGIELQGGDGSIVEYNTVDSSGNNGIFIRGNNTMAKNNFINYFGLTVDDCGGIYTAGATVTGRKIIGNIILNGIGNREGTPSTSRSTQGIYLDEPITGIYVEGNTVAHCGLAGLRYHNAYGITARFNTLYDNPNNIYIIKSNATSTYSRNLKINNNISVCKTSTQLAFSIYNYINDNPLLYGSSDSNYYCRPISEGNTIKTKNVNTTVNYNIESWQTETGNDLHSHKSPQIISDVNDILFEYNATSSTKIIPLAHTYISVDSIFYSGNVTLTPYSSIILFKSSNNIQNQQPNIQNQGFFINENSVNGTNAGTVVASDPDAGQTLSYSILSGNTGGAFAINTSTGVLTVANSSALNFEVTPSFALVVKVQDNGTGLLSSQALVIVSLTDANESPTVNNQNFDVIEFAANGTSAGTVIASDPDAGQLLSYSIASGNTGNAFLINATTGELTVANSTALNYLVNPTFVLNITVTDNGTGNLSDNAIVIITVIQTPNQAPIINNQAFSVAENSVNGTNAGTVIASDPDAGQTLSYSILSGNAGGAFAINASAGVLTVANSSALNFEVTPYFALIIKVQDNGTGTLSSQAIVTVLLTDINEAPVINNQALSVAENSANGTNVGTVVASDPDAGQVLAYSIFSGNTGGAFAINTSTGVLTVANSSILNFEINPSFALIVKVQDNGSVALSSQASVTINLVNVNEAPVVTNQLFIINENSPNGTLVGTVIASDPDAGQVLAYSILSGNVTNDFVINATTGVISVANSSALNFEENSSFALLINVQDNGVGNLSSQAIATVALNDVNETPIINNQFFTLAENSSNGTIVGTVVSTDPDAGQVHVYSIISGNENGTFSINATSGIITIANSTALNFEENSSFALVVNVQDNGPGNLSSQAIIKVSLTDVNENPTVDNQTFSVNEFAQNGTEVGTVEAIDPDAGQTLTYTITAGNTNNAFEINSATGLITTINSYAISYLNIPVFYLMVRVYDNGAGNLFNDCIITIHVLPGINQPPVINDQTFFVNENSINGSSVGFVEAFDPDAGQILNYSILTGNIANAFAINSLTGEITITNSFALNYNSNPIFILTVNVQDNGTLSLEDQATVTINLLDTNEPPVITNQTYNTIEHQPVGTQVCAVLASGSGSGNSLSYSIQAGNIGNSFAINSYTGDLTINNPNAVCYEGNPEFDLLVKVQDSEGLAAEAIVTVKVMDINENPVCNNQVFSIHENALYNTIVGTVIATEPDFNQTLTYTIVSGNLNNAFSLSETDGLIKVNNSAALNYENNQVFTLVVSVQDNGLGNLITNSTITINLLDVNEYPVFENQVFEVVENSASGTVIGYLSASDPDAGQSIIYSIIGGNEDQTFALNPATGLLSVADPALLFFDLNPIYTLTVIAQDNSTNSLVTLALATISVLKEIGGQIIYIDPTNENDPAENGTIDHPYDSWQDFTFKNGSTYLQKRGTTYKSDNSIIISKKTNITVDAYGNGDIPVIINLQTVAQTFEFDNTINCAIRNLEIMTDQKALSCILVTGDESKSMTIENCKLHEAVYGISSSSRIKDFRIINTDIYNTGLDGINADEFMSIEIRDCKISSVNQNWFSDPYAAGSCINLSSSDGKVYIHKNELDHTATGNMSVIRLNGSKMEGLIEHNSLSGNKVSDNHCLNLSNNSGIYIVRYNTIIGGKTGVNVNSESVKIYYNQMIGNQVAIKVQQNKAALIMNNTFVANDNFAVESLTSSKVVSMNNIYYLTPAAPKAFKVEGSFVSDFNLYNIEKSGFLNGYSTLATWTAATGQDKNSQVKDPQFENGAEGNFRIKPNSPGINKGSDLKLEKDFFGTKVPQAGKPDIGFCEVENGSVEAEEETIPLVDINSLIDLTIYPNPTTGIIKIDLEKVIEHEVRIRIINMNGYQIYSTVSQGQKELEVNLENEKSGMYIVHFVIGGTEFTKGVVVKR